jgi:hypothetical protein
MLSTREERERVGETALALLGWSYLAYAYTLRADGIPHVVLCPWRLLTGISCPLCGTTRSWDAMLHGDWELAFAMHPVAPLILPVWIAASVLLSARVIAAWRWGTAGKSIA